MKNITNINTKLGSDKVLTQLIRALNDNLKDGDKFNPELITAEIMGTTTFDKCFKAFVFKMIEAAENKNTEDFMLYFLAEVSRWYHMGYFASQNEAELVKEN